VLLPEASSRCGSCCICSLRVIHLRLLLLLQPLRALTIKDTKEPIRLASAGITLELQGIIITICLWHQHVGWV
jgi:hypothetical protein